MKILHVTPDFNFATSFVKPICLEQVKWCDDVTVVSTQAFYSIDKEQAQLYFLFEEHYPKLHLKLLNLRFRKFEVTLLRSFLTFITMLRKEKYNVIVFHTTIDSLIPMILAFIFSRSKKVYFNHGVPSLGYNGVTKFFLNCVENINISIADLVFTIGPSMSTALKSINKHARPYYASPGSACGIRLISNSYDEIIQKREQARKKLKIPLDKKVVIFVGRPVKRKGLFDLIEAWKQLVGNDSYLLLLAGPKADDLKKIGYPISVVPMGYISNVEEFYLAADLLCVPSYHEGLGYIYLEAAAAGCVPISSNIPGPIDFISKNLNGWTVEAGNIENIKSTLEELLNDDLKRLSLSKAAFLSVSSFDRDVIAPKVALKLVE